MKLTLPEGELSLLRRTVLRGLYLPFWNTSSRCVAPSVNRRTGCADWCLVSENSSFYARGFDCTWTTDMLLWCLCVSGWIIIASAIFIWSIRDWLGGWSFQVCQWWPYQEYWDILVDGRCKWTSLPFGSFECIVVMSVHSCAAPISFHGIPSSFLPHAPFLSPAWILGVGNPCASVLFPARRFDMTSHTVIFNWWSFDVGACFWYLVFFHLIKAIGMLFKRGSTISAAEGGCQAEVGGGSFSLFPVSWSWLCCLGE